MTAQAAKEYLFGPFRFIPARQCLLDGNIAVPLGSRALEILAVLVERPGELVSKRELIARAWPARVVEESNLKVHVAALRRALGDGLEGFRYVATVSRRGYRFVAPVLCIEHETQFAQGDLARLRHLPACASRAIGRKATIDALLRQLPDRRLTTIVGLGGVGKTTVALAVAEAAAAQHGMEVCFVDLSPLVESQFVASALATALELTLHSGDVLQAVLASLRERHLLLVLDSCEHVIDAAAELAETIIGGTMGVRVLATSREPLRARGEAVHRLHPLEYPPAGPAPTAEQAMAYPAVHLFVERAAECLQGYQLSDADAPAVAEICRRLEGIALAIELAATRMDAFGARELAARLDDSFRLLKRGLRGAEMRHRTMAAALDWSYEFLPAPERAVFRAVAVFANAFTLDLATGMLADTPDDAAGIVDCVAELVAKSLLSADVSAAAVRYRLLDTSKAYALEKLAACAELQPLLRRHAALHLTLLQRAAVEWERRPTQDWIADYGHRIDDVRGALAWAFSPSGDAAVGVALTVAAIPLWMHLSLLTECRLSVERALAAGVAAHGLSAGDEMKLLTARGAATLYAWGPLADADAVWLRALELAEQLDDGEYQLRTLWGLAVYRSYTGDYRSVHVLAARFRAVAAKKGDRAARVSVDRLTATALHYMGDQQGARRHLERMLEQYRPAVHRSHIARFQLDQRAAAQGTLANVLWLQGYADQAVHSADAALRGARDSGHALSLVNALVHAACPIAFYVGDLDAGGQLLDELLDHLTRHAMTMWMELWRCLRGALLLRRGDAAGIPLLRAALDEFRETGLRLRYPAYLGALAAGLGMHGQADEGRALIEEALACSARSEERWCLPELLRIKGELLEQASAADAEQCYRRAMELARRQGALSWELRAATSFARLCRRQGREAEGVAPLAAVYGGFSEGYETADMRQAYALLGELGCVPLHGERRKLLLTVFNKT